MITAPDPQPEPGAVLPPGLLLAVYGDDFTGSAAVMEVLTFAGLPTALFLGPPTAAQRGRFDGLRAIVMAGSARAQSPDWMDDHLPAVFDSLADLDAPMVHYKICSTVNSSPATGSIGRAIEIALLRFGTPVVPVLVAAPPLRRYQCFGHLFASAPGGVFRIDRHPVMAHHPVTPMRESDVVAHLSAQTMLPVGLVNLEQLALAPQEVARAVAQGTRILCLDTIDAEHLALCGRLLWDQRGPHGLCVGSQGIEYALVAYWRSAGLLPDAPPLPRLGPTRGMAVVSGSLSSITAEQIAWAVEHGFTEIPVNAAALLSGDTAAEDAALDVAMQALADGQIPIVSTSGTVMTGNPEPSGLPGGHALIGSALIGSALGRILRRIIMQAGLRRAVIAGGDTSSFATAELGIFALTATAPTVPGAAICTAHADIPQIDGVELALKGGQMGTVDYFGQVRNGGTEPRTTT